MTKECPHCGVDRFGLWDLFKLTVNYPDAFECRNCAGLVRNSGQSQFVILLLTALLVVFDFVLLSPFVPAWIVFSSLLALIPLPMMLVAKPVRAEIPRGNLPPFIPDPNNDKAITVSGWDEDELHKALEDFTSRNRSGSPLKIEISKQLETRYRLTFPEDLAVVDFAALINYLNYPIDLGSPERTITVAGQTSLSPEFAGVPQSLWGETAILYVPADDDDYDVVHLQTETGPAFAFSFNQEGVWRQVDNPRSRSSLWKKGEGERA